MNINIPELEKFARPVGGFTYRGRAVAAVEPIDSSEGFDARLAANGVKEFVRRRFAGEEPEALRNPDGSFCRWVHVVEIGPGLVVRLRANIPRSEEEKL